MRPLSFDWCVPALDDTYKMYTCRDISILCLVIILSGTLTDRKESWSIDQGTNTSKLNIFSWYQSQIRTAFKKRAKSPFRIAMGSRARKGEFKYLVSLQSTDETSCGHESKPYHQCGGAVVTRTGIFSSCSLAFRSDFLVHFVTINNLFGCYSGNLVFLRFLFSRVLGWNVWFFKLFSSFS